MAHVAPKRPARVSPPAGQRSDRRRRTARGRGVSVLEALRSALDALRANLLRSALTMLGIIIGVTAVIVMVAIGTGAKAKVMQQIQSLGSNLIIVISGSTTLGGVRMG